MKFLISLLFFSSILFISFATASKKYYIDNVQNQFWPHFESEFYHNFPEKSQTVDSVWKLTTSLLHNIYVRAGKGFNIALSPVSIWTILAMLLEGAGGKTESELKAKLQVSYIGHEEGKSVVRNRYKELLNFNQGRSSPTEFTTINFVISDKKKGINLDYQNIIRQFYNGQYFEADGPDNDRFAKTINSWASKVTKNKISNLVSPAVLNNLLLVVGSAVYFMSKWKYPFDPSQTILMLFKDEYGKPIKNVPMMNQVAVLPYTYNSRIESEIVEIPYADGQTSMIIILPKERVSMADFLARIKHMSMNEFIPRNFTDETIQLIIPRFHIESKMYLNEVLKPDLRSVFSSLAEFPYIGKSVFVSKVLHKTEIENTEEGTTASAVSVVQFAYKSSSVNFKADRPFIYLINEVKTRTILFAGTYTNPFIS